MVEKMKEEAKEADGLEKKDYQEVDIVDEQQAEEEQQEKQE